MSDTGDRIQALESECQNLANKIQENAVIGQQALDGIRESNKDVKELLKVFNAAKGALLFAKWLAGITALFGSAYIAIMKVKGS